jgi:hypothetical protein
MTWKFSRGVWICNPFSIALEVCERRKLTYFELYDSTRFVKSFASLQEAQEHARGMSFGSMERVA